MTNLVRCFGCLFVILVAGQCASGITRTVARSSNSADTEKKIRILNPYSTLGFFYKGQLHVHTDKSDGAYSPKKMFELYRKHGYHFVSLTDHDTQVSCSDIFSDPGVAGILHIPGEEGGMGHRTHLLEVGLLVTSPCRPDGVFDLQKRIDWVERQGGLAIAPHPLSSLKNLTWTEKELFESLWLRGIEIHTPEYRDLWDRLLRGDVIRWGFATDDAHRSASMNRGWVIVSSRLERPNRIDIMTSLREGRFYSVLAGRGYTGQKVDPHFSAIEVVGESIKVTFLGTKQVRFIGRHGVLKQHDYGFDQLDLYSLIYPVQGHEGYVRIELENSQGTVAYSQPLFVYGTSVEDCLPFDYTRAAVTNIEGGYQVAVNGRSLLNFPSHEHVARQALNVIKHYKMDRQCYIRRPFANMIYYTVDDKAPVGAFPDEDCLRLDVNNVEVRLVTNANVDPPTTSWKIVDGDRWVADFRDSEIQAHRALEIIKKYGFDHLCFVGRTLQKTYGMQYFRSQ